jgi:hypothetical protein
VANETTYQANITYEIPQENITETLTQGRAVVGQPVNWTKTIMVNSTDNIEVRTDIPTQAESIAVFQIEVSHVEQSAGVQAGPTSITSKRPLSPHEFSISEAPSVSPITGFAAKDSAVGNGIFTRLIRWLDSLFAMTGLVSLGPDSVILVSPEKGESSGRNVNFIYETSYEFDSCSIFLDGFRVKTDELVLAGTNFFELRGMEYGNHSWLISCDLGGASIDSQDLTFNVIEGISLNMTDEDILAQEQNLTGNHSEETASGTHDI